MQATKAFRHKKAQEKTACTAQNTLENKKKEAEKLSSESSENEYYF